MLGLGSTPGSTSLQATLAAGSALSVITDGVEPIHPHHPLTCGSRQLAYHDDGSMSCDHAKTEPGDLRTRHAINGSIAYLIFELALNL